jgi:hypothetical protein
MVERVKAKKPIFKSVPPELRKCSLGELKAKWRDQVMYDPELTASCRVLAYWLVDRMTLPNSKSIYKDTKQIVIWGAQANLAKEMQMYIETVADGIARLIERGHLYLLERGNHRTGSNRYLVIVKSDCKKPNYVQRPTMSI